MAEKNPKKMRIPNNYLSDSNSLDEETSQHLEERGPAKHPKIKKLPKGQASDKSTQTAEKDKSH